MSNGEFLWFKKKILKKGKKTGPRVFSCLSRSDASDAPSASISVAVHTSQWPRVALRFKNTSALLTRRLLVWIWRFFSNLKWITRRYIQTFPSFAPTFEIPAFFFTNLEWITWRFIQTSSSFAPILKFPPLFKSQMNHLAFHSNDRVSRQIWNSRLFFKCYVTSPKFLTWLDR